MERGAGTLTKRRNLDKPGTRFYVVLVCLLCWLTGYITSLGYPIHTDVNATPLWNTICRILPGKSFTYLTGSILITGSAFLLQRANHALVLIREKTLLPFLFYILFLSTNPSFFPLKATSAGVFCLILAIYLLFISYHNPETKEEAYRTGLVIGIGSLFWIQILWFVPLFWIGMHRFRIWNKKTFAASFTGILTVYWFVLAWSIWQNDYSLFTKPFTILWKSIDLLQFRNMEILEWIRIAYIFVLVIIASVNILTHEYEDNLRTRQFLSFLMILMAWNTILFFLYEQSAEEFLHIACIPTSILVAHFFSTRRNRYTVILFYFTLLFFPALLFFQLWNFL